MFAGLIIGVAFAIWLGQGQGLSALGPKSNPHVPRSSALSTPEPCGSYSAERTRQVITDFLSAYNAGTPDITDQFIAPAGDFQWFGAPDRVFPDDPASMDRKTLPAYFATAHARGDNLELRDFTFNGRSYHPDIPDWTFDFRYILIHTVRGANPNPARGKGAIGCKSGKIVVWLIDSW